MSEEMKCHCGRIYQAKTADLKRGWALSCSKRCAAVRKTHKMNAATKVNGEQIPKKWKSNKPKRVAVIPESIIDDDEWLGSFGESGYFGHGQS